LRTRFLDSTASWSAGSLRRRACTSTTRPTSAGCPNRSPDRPHDSPRAVVLEPLIRTRSLIPRKRCGFDQGSPEGTVSDPDSGSAAVVEPSPRMRSQMRLPFGDQPHIEGELLPFQLEGCGLRCATRFRPSCKSPHVRSGWRNSGPRPDQRAICRAVRNRRRQLSQGGCLQRGFSNSGRPRVRGG
jgi:hypothetical protein